MASTSLKLFGACFLMCAALEIPSMMGELHKKKEDFEKKKELYKAAGQPIVRHTLSTEQLDGKILSNLSRIDTVAYVYKDDTLKLTQK